MNLAQILERLREDTTTDTWYDTGKTLTCRETEAIGGLLDLLGLDEFTDALLQGHTESDEPGDHHYKEEAR